MFISKYLFQCLLTLALKSPIGEWSIKIFIYLLRCHQIFWSTYLFSISTQFTTNVQQTRVVYWRVRVGNLSVLRHPLLSRTCFTKRLLHRSSCLEINQNDSLPKPLLTPVQRLHIRSHLSLLATLFAYLILGFMLHCLTPSGVGKTSNLSLN